MNMKDYICVDNFGDIVDLSVFVNEYICARYSDYIKWLDGEKDLFYYRLDYIDSDSGCDFEEWLEEEYPYISLLDKEECI